MGPDTAIGLLFQTPADRLDSGADRQDFCRPDYRLAGGCTCVASAERAYPVADRGCGVFRKSRTAGRGLVGQPACGGPGQFRDVNRHADAAVLVSRAVLFYPCPSGQQICLSLDHLLRYLYRAGGAGQICRTVFPAGRAGRSGYRQKPPRPPAGHAGAGVLYGCACHLSADLGLEYQQRVCDHPAFGRKCQSAGQPGLIQRGGRVLGGTAGCGRACCAGDAGLHNGQSRAW